MMTLIIIINVLITYDNSIKRRRSDNKIIALKRENDNWEGKCFVYWFIRFEYSSNLIYYYIILYYYYKWKKETNICNYYYLIEIC